MPQPAVSDTLHGRYTWTIFTDSGMSSITQASLFQLQSDASGNPTVFTMRVDKTVPNFQRRFNDLTASYHILGGSLFIDSIRFQGNGGNANVPFGRFLFSCKQDSGVFLGGSNPGETFADTVMRITIRQ